MRSPMGMSGAASWSRLLAHCAMSAMVAGCLLADVATVVMPKML